MKALLSAIVTAAVVAASGIQAQTTAVQPVGEHATIDVRLAKQTIDTLMSGTDEQIAQTVSAIRESPERYAPPVFYYLSKRLFDQGDKDDAAFWYYAGQLRARFDANRCADSTARQAVSVLNERFGTPINQYTFTDLDALEALVTRVVAWDRATPHEYDHRWINLHGMEAVTDATGGGISEEPLSLPEEEWDAIAERTRVEYLEGLRQALAQLRDEGGPEDTTSTTSLPLHDALRKRQDARFRALLKEGANPNEADGGGKIGRAHV